MSDLTLQNAELYARQGYVVFAADIYGRDVHLKTVPEFQAQSAIYNKDRPLMRARAQAGFEVLRDNPMVDPAKIAVVGYCFGGTVAIEFAEAGAPVVGTVTIHGSFRNFTPGAAKNITGRVLILHGSEDPVAPLSEVDLLVNELRAANVAWELNLYSGTKHGFSTPKSAPTRNPNSPRRASSSRFLDCNGNPQKRPSVRLPDPALLVVTDRRQARRVAVSPLARDSLGNSGIELAAIEIAKAIASYFLTPLNDHLVSLDLSGPTIVKHYVPRRPQCPSCGSKKLRDPRRAPVPLVLTAGAKPVMTSGGYRSVSSRATVAKYRKHVSPLTGVVSKLERVEVDLPLNTNYYASHNFSGPAKSINELRSGRSGGSFGKGSTAEQGEASALMEAIERYSGIFQGDEIRVTRRFADFAPGEAITPNDVLLFSDAQYRRPPSEEDVTPTPPPFDPSAKIEWTPVWSLRDQRFKYLPTGMLYFFHTDAFDSHMHADSNGCAAGNTLEEAIVQGFLELVERDSYAIWWYNRSQRTELDLSQFDDSYVRDLKNQLAETGRRLWVLDITTDLAIPSYVAMSYSTITGQEFVEYGSGSHFDPRIALLRALTEVNQFLSIGLMGARDAGQASNDSAGPFRLEEHPYLIPDGKPAIRPRFDAKFGSLDTREQTLACVDIVKRAGLDFLVLDQTRPDIETPVVRVIVPGLRHFYRRFAPGRLYDVPVKLGLRDTPIPESELNPLHPHT